MLEISFYSYHRHFPQRINRYLATIETDIQYESNNNHEAKTTERKSRRQ